MGYSTVLTVGGSHETYPVITCKPGGSVSYLKLTNMDTGEFVRINESLNTSASVVIDMGEQLVTVNGQNHAVTYESDYFALQPGRNSLRLSSGTGTIEWTERHIG